MECFEAGAIEQARTAPRAKVEMLLCLVASMERLAIRSERAFGALTSSRVGSAAPEQRSRAIHVKRSGEDAGVSSGDRAAGLEAGGKVRDASIEHERTAARAMAKGRYARTLRRSARGSMRSRIRRTNFVASCGRLRFT
jgi:hypothetical protein